MFSLEELAALSQVDLTTVDRSKLVEINDIVIDPDASIPERAEQFFSQIGNPYCFLVDGITVRVCFNPDGKPLSQVLSDYFISIK
jgi:hypothetical protein